MLGFNRANRALRGLRRVPPVPRLISGGGGGGGANPKSSEGVGEVGLAFIGVAGTCAGAWLAAERYALHKREAERERVSSDSAAARVRERSEAASARESERREWTDNGAAAQKRAKAAFAENAKFNNTRNLATEFGISDRTCTAARCTRG